MQVRLPELGSADGGALCHPNADDAADPLYLTGKFFSERVEHEVPLAIWSRRDGRVPGLPPSLPWLSSGMLILNHECHSKRNQIVTGHEM
jgi:hypothetical protein